jgi:ubiquinone biosynthesis protein UbiJ
MVELLMQTLCKDKQRKLSLVFGQCTSGQYVQELLQVKLNSDSRFRQIRSEIASLQNEEPEIEVQITTKSIMNQSNSVVRNDTS